MKISQKISLLRSTVKEIKKISENLENDNLSEAVIDELNNEVSKLREGITESVTELEKILRDENA